jgi:hypothetical protein
MAKKMVYEFEVNGTEEAEGKFVRLQKQIKDTRIEMQKASEVGDTIRFNELRGQLEELNDKFEKVQLQSKEFHDALATMPGPAGKAGQAIQAVDSAFKSLLANPVIAIIAAIAGVFLLMYEALKKTAEGQKALSAVTDAFGRIITPIIKFISAVAVPVFNALASAIDFVAAAFADFTGSYANFQKEIANDTAMRQAEQNAKRIGEFLDEEGYKYDELTKKKLTAKKEYNDKLQKIYADENNTEEQRNRKIANAGLELNKKLADVDAERAKKSADAQKAASDKATAAAQKAFQDKVALMGAEDKLDEAKLEKMKAEALATADTEQKKFAIESLYATKKYTLQRNNILELQREYKNDSKEYKDYQTQLINLDANRIAQLTTDAEKKKKLKEDEFKKQMEVDALLDALFISTLKKEEDREEATFQSRRRAEKIELSARLADLKYSEEQINEALKQFDEATEILNDERKEKKKQKALQEELEILNIRKGALQTGTAEYFNILRQIEDNAYQQKLNAAKGNKEKELELEKEHLANLDNIRKQELNQYLSYATTTLSGVSNILNMASANMQKQQEIDIQNAEGNEEKITEIKKKAFEDNKKMQIAQAIIGTLQAAVQAYQSLAVIPVVGPALGAAAAAAALIFGYKQVDLIKQTKYNDSASKGSSGSAKAQAPAFNGTVSVPAPQIGASSAQSSGNLGQVIGTAVQENNSQSRPIQAYVVGDQVSTQQQLDRRITLAAQMGGS